MSKSLHQLSSPKGSLLFGHTFDFAKDPLSFLTACATDYGEIVPLRFLFSSACLLTQAQHIEQVLKQPELFTKHTPAWQAVRSLVGEGLLTSEGAFWARQRRLIQPMFHQQRIAAYGETMVLYAERMVQTWQEGEVRDVHQDMMQLTLNIVTKTLLNVDMTGVAAQTIAQTLEVAMEWFFSRRKQAFLPLTGLPTPINRRYKQALQTMDQAIYALIQQRRQSDADPGDLLSLLLQAQDEDGSRMSDRQLRDELTTLILAGHETTANALSWTWMLLAQHTAVESKLVSELQAVLGGRSPTLADLPQLRYTEHIIKEALRLYPPLFSLARAPMQDCELAGYHIPAKYILIFSPWVMHRSARYFTNPLQFQPERWEHDLEKQLPKGVYFPFGEGPRVCIGRSFALMEAVLLLATIAQKYQLRLLPDQLLTPLPSMTLRPKAGIIIRVTKRTGFNE
ncbi:cytochrome P450 [Phormidesmis priestleyi]|uniref:cytochrome P450 n=1 Tax=Phormidesmis priestleyi TaxID=268141 RepID=UPI00083B9F1E|nr:cytochrome P450 [Phormidesmis priestleyi]